MGTKVRYSPKSGRLRQLGLHPAVARATPPQRCIANSLLTRMSIKDSTKGLSGWSFWRPLGLPLRHHCLSRGARHLKQALAAVFPVTVTV